MLGWFLGASFYLMAWLTSVRLGKGCEGNRSGEHTVSQTASDGNHKGVQPGMWDLGSFWRIYYWKWRPLQFPTRKYSVPIQAWDRGEKTYLVNRRHLQHRERQEKSRCSGNLVIQLQCAQTRWGEWISILQCSHAFPLQKHPCQITQAK